jgi:hypothetical protein
MPLRRHEPPFSSRLAIAKSTGDCHHPSPTTWLVWTSARSPRLHAGQAETHPQTWWGVAAPNILWLLELINRTNISVEISASSPLHPPFLGHRLQLPTGIG